jgi:general secretion pathway protein K
MCSPPIAPQASLRKFGSDGFALVIVLWSVGLLALLATQLTATTRTQLRLTAQARDEAIAEAAADGAIRQAMFVLLGGRRIDSSGAPMRVRLGDALVSILARDEAATINPNAASDDVLRRLMVALGIDRSRAALLTAEMADWRSAGQISLLGGAKIDRYRDRVLPYRSGDHVFYSVDEIGLVPDMTADVLARLRPWLSVYQEGDVNDPTGATPAAAAVAGTADSGTGTSFGSRNLVMRVTAAAVLPGRARFVRSAVLRLRADAMANPGKGGAMIQVLTWE